MKLLILALLYSTLYGQTVTPPSGSSVSGGAVGGASSVITNNAVECASGVGAIKDCTSAAIIPGLNISGSLVVGSGGPTCTPGTAGAFCISEGTSPSVGATSGVDVIYGDSTQHGFMASFNNAPYLPLVQGPASATSGHVAVFSGTNGGLLVDGGAPGVGTIGGSIAGGNPGPVPYVSAANTLSVDSGNALYIDASNHRVGILTNAPTGMFQIQDGTNHLLFQRTVSSNSYFTGSVGNDFWIGTGVTNGAIALGNDATGLEYLIVKGASVGIGNTNTTFGAGTTFSVLDRTASTGATAVYLGGDNNGHTSATTTQVNLIAGTSQSSTPVVTLPNALLPLIYAKVTGAATAPTAGNCTLRLEAGTNSGTGKLVAYCGTSSTGVIIADNVGAGF